MQTILVAVTESVAAAEAAETAAELAAALGARLVVVSVLDGAPAHPDAVRAVQQQVQALGREMGIDVDARTVHGHAGEELVRHARAVGADLAVIAGTLAGPDAVAETAQRLLAACHVPVLLVPGTGVQPVPA